MTASKWSIENWVKPLSSDWRRKENITEEKKIHPKVLNESGIFNNFKRSREIQATKFRSEPITSFGLVLAVTSSNSTEWLISLPRNSPEYCEFLRDKISSKEMAKRYIENFREDEKKRLLTKKSSDILKDFYLGSEEAIPEFKRKEKICKGNIERYRQFLSEPTFKGEKHWGFPKGRRDGLETEIDCILREFKEETEIPTERIIIRSDLPKFEEYYTGSDNNRYRTVYHIGMIDKKDLVLPIVKSGPLRRYISKEISEIKVCTFGELSKYIDRRKLEIITEISSLLGEDIPGKDIEEEENYQTIDERTRDT